MEKVKFRWHRGGLAEAMATVIEDTPENIRKLVKENFPEFPGDVTSFYCCYDSRTGWDTHMVVIDKYPAGFADGSIND